MGINSYKKILDKIRDLERDLYADITIQEEIRQWELNYVPETYDGIYGIRRPSFEDETIVQERITKPDMETRERAKKELQELYPEIQQCRQQIQQGHQQLQNYYSQTQQTYNSYKWYQFFKKTEIKKQLNSIEEDLKHLEYDLERINRVTLNRND